MKRAEEELQDLNFEIDLKKFEPTREENRAEKLLWISDVQLRRYYNLNLNQNLWVLALGVFCILLGVAVIAATAYMVLTVPVDSKILTGVLGAVGALLVNFVAAIYLNMHSRAAINLSAFHSRLVGTHEILLANLLASHIEDDKKRWETISDLAPRLCGPPHEAQANSPEA